MESNPESKLLALIKKLREQHPGESREQLVRRLAKPSKEDKTLGL